MSGNWRSLSDAEPEPRVLISLQPGKASAPWEWVGLIALSLGVLLGKWEGTLFTSQGLRSWGVHMFWKPEQIGLSMCFHGSWASSSMQSKFPYLVFICLVFLEPLGPGPQIFRFLLPSGSLGHTLCLDFSWDSQQSLEKTILPDYLSSAFRDHFPQVPCHLLDAFPSKPKYKYHKALLHPQVILGGYSESPCV